MKISICLLSILPNCKMFLLNGFHQNNGNFLCLKINHKTIHSPLFLSFRGKCKNVNFGVFLIFNIIFSFRKSIIQYGVLGLNLLHLMKGGLDEEEVVSSRLKSSQIDDTDTLRPLEQDKISLSVLKNFRISK